MWILPVEALSAVFEVGTASVVVKFSKQLKYATSITYVLMSCYLHGLNEMRGRDDKYYPLTCIVTAHK